MLRYRDYKASTSSLFSRVWRVVATALAFVAVPVLVLLCWMIPPLRRALHDTAPARMGKAFRKRNRGDHQGAYVVAMEGLARCRLETPTRSAESMAALNWWGFLELAAEEAEHLGDAERAQVTQALDAAPAPGGMRAAACMSKVARWTWRGGDRDGAIRLAREAILADIALTPRGRAADAPA